MSVFNYGDRQPKPAGTYDWWSNYIDADVMFWPKWAQKKCTVSIKAWETRAGKKDIRLSKEAILKVVVRQPEWATEVDTIDDICTELNNGKLLPEKVRERAEQLKLRLV